MEEEGKKSLVEVDESRRLENWVASEYMPLVFLVQTLVSTEAPALIAEICLEGAAEAIDLLPGIKSLMP